MSDHDSGVNEKVYEVYENQRLYIFVGWSAQLLPQERPSWSDVTGRISISKDVVLDAGWQWVDTWRIDFSDDVGEEGWQYATLFTDKKYSKSLQFGQFVR